MQKKKRGRLSLGSIERDILEELTVGDLLYGFLLSSRSHRRMRRLAYERANERYRRKKALQRLENRGYIRTASEKVSITTDGLNALGAQVMKYRKQLGARTWDGKWRIAAFDIPQTHNHLRNKVRAILKRAGFVQLQQSIWVFPHDCEELVQLIKSESRLPSCILFGVMERVEDEARLKRLFKLE